MVRIVVSRHRYWPVVTAIALLVTNGPYVVSTVGWVEGAGRVGITAGVAFVILTIMSKARSVAIGRGVLVLTLGVLTFIAVNETLGHTFFGPFPALSWFISGVMNGALFLVLTLLLGIVQVARSEHRDIRDELETLLGQEYFSNRAEMQRIRERHRDLAHLIHGRLQNQVLGLVFALTKNPSTSSPSELLREIDLIDQVISTSGSLPAEGEGENLSDEVEGLVARWRGIVAITITLGNEVNPRSQPTHRVMGLIEEAVTNAVRHGIASAVTISLDQVNEYWVITVTDDGVGPRQGRAGLGTTTLNNLAGENWSLTPHPETGGAILRAHIPVTLATRD
jgi:signal transduction histidine kinase